MWGYAHVGISKTFENTRYEIRDRHKALGIRREASAAAEELEVIHVYYKNDYCWFL